MSSSDASEELIHAVPVFHRPLGNLRHPPYRHLRLSAGSEHRRSPPCHPQLAARRSPCQYLLLHLLLTYVFCILSPQLIIRFFQNPSSRFIRLLDIPLRSSAPIRFGLAATIPFADSRPAPLRADQVVPIEHRNRTSIFASPNVRTKRQPQ